MEETATCNNESSRCSSPYWKKLRNVLNAVVAFKRCEVKVVENLDDLVEEVKNSPSRHLDCKSKSTTFEAIDEHKLIESLFFYISRSSKEDLIRIENLIESHPKRYTRNAFDPEHFLNKANITGTRPINEAAKNGYSETVQLLIDHGANPKLRNKDGEHCLSVAVRWGHLNVVKSLLRSCSWTRREISDAVPYAVNHNILKMLTDSMPKKKCHCLCLS